jgi:transglutaminase superfamily protein
MRMVRAAHPPLARVTKLALGLEILAAYARVRWLLWRGDLVTTLKRVRADGEGPGFRALRHDDLGGQRLGNAVGRTLRVLPTDSRCLMRSLVLSSLLARRQIDSSLVIGVRSGPSFAAHAWVEHEGEALLPDGDDRYLRLVEL